jgi:hypothetical protein
MRNVTECQQRLIELGFLPALNAAGQSNADGKFGLVSLDAYNRFRRSHGRAPVQNVSMAELNADLFPEEQPVAPVRKPSLFDQIGAVASIIALLKGKTMTKDQIEGVIRTLLVALFSYLAGKGVFPQVSPEVITALTTVIVGAWSLWSNRPKVIEPLKK